ncbi:MAG: transcription termination/antitermination protein NusG [Candidatus Cloacimonetes bacterium]|jgi:transcriptional antiterminator NusG|nr:transcription termination/antitermination protein NusG [Candidatus Cloacimonadota bacterium]MDD4156355.1 transcription termination/antitermination protein NusG [Candidatus Cloacimonadota bacterium]
MKMWYVLHTYTAQEDRVKDAILKGTKDTELESLVGEILVPKQKTYHIREGKKIEREKKIFNSYIIIQADLTPHLHSYIVNLPGVTNFLGSGKRAYTLPKNEVDRLLGIEERGKSKVNSYDFIPGDKVKIINGPFADFEGIVDKINSEAAKLIIKVTVFGRVTPVEVNMDQVEII